MRMNLDTFDGLAQMWRRGLVTEAELVVYLNNLLEDPEAKMTIAIGRTLGPTLQFSFNPDDITREPDADRIVFEPLSRLLGRKLGGAKVAGCWVIMEHLAGAWTPIYGHLVGQRRRKLGAAIASALGRAVVCTVEIKGA